MTDVTQFGRGVEAVERIDAGVRDHNPEKTVGGHGGTFILLDVNPLVELLIELHDEPELAKPDAVRQAAEQRLADAELIQRVMFEMSSPGFDGELVSWFSGVR